MKLDVSDNRSEEENEYTFELFNNSLGDKQPGRLDYNYKSLEQHPWEQSEEGLEFGDP